VDVDEEIRAVIASPGTSFWLRKALEEALTRDCVDAANDAELLSEILARRCDAVVARSPEGLEVCDSQILEVLTSAKNQNAKVAADLELVNSPSSSEFERGRQAEMDRLATELFKRGGFGTLQLNTCPGSFPRMRFVDPGTTQQVRAVRIGDGVMLVRKGTSPEHDGD
jgi:hypothetical protein